MLRSWLPKRRQRCGAPRRVRSEARSFIGRQKYCVGRWSRSRHAIALEIGKPVREALAEVQRSVELLRFFGGEGWRPVGEVFDQSGRAGTISVLHRPVGVVGLLTPWNFPLSIPTWKSGPALIYGNTVVLKVANEAPSAVLYLASALQTAGLPDGVFNVVVGDGTEAGAALVEHQGIRALSFTGSRLSASRSCSGRRLVGASYSSRWVGTAHSSSTARPIWSAPAKPP